MRCVIKVWKMNDRYVNRDLPAGCSSALRHHSVSGGWSSSCLSGYKLSFQEDTLLWCSQPLCVPSGVMGSICSNVAKSQWMLSRLWEDLCTGTQSLHDMWSYSQGKQDLWASMRVHRAQQHVLKLKSDPQQRRSIQEATQLSLICFHILNCAQTFFFL